MQPLYSPAMTPPRKGTGRKILPVLQISTGALTCLASSFDGTAWWVVAVPWAILNLPGIILAIPVIAFAFLMAGGTHLDWMNEEFFVSWFIAIPTVLSLIACRIWTGWRRKRITLSRRKVAMAPRL